MARQGGECRANVQDLAAKPSELLRAPWEATSEWPLGGLRCFGAAKVSTEMMGYQHGYPKMIQDGHSKKEKYGNMIQ